MLLMFAFDIFLAMLAAMAPMTSLLLTVAVLALFEAVLAEVEELLVNMGHVVIRWISLPGLDCLDPRALDQVVHWVVAVLVIALSFS